MRRRCVQRLRYEAISPGPTGATSSFNGGYWPVSFDITEVAAYAAAALAHVGRRFGQRPSRGWN